MKPDLYARRDALRAQYQAALIKRRHKRAHEIQAQLQPVVLTLLARESPAKRKRRKAA